jgi:hypothetical protein
MNKFVDYGKRSITLPAGCSDLIDVLQRPSRRPGWIDTQGVAQGLAVIAKHLRTLLEPASRHRNLVITWHEMNYLHLTSEAGLLTAVAVVHGDTGRERTVRQVFHAAGVAPILDEAVAGGALRVLRYPLTCGASDLKKLISALLRSGLGLPDNASLKIGFWENDAPY